MTKTRRTGMTYEMANHIDRHNRTTKGPMTISQELTARIMNKAKDLALQYEHRAVVGLTGKARDALARDDSVASIIKELQL